MANRARGYVSFVLGGETLELKLTLNAMAEIQDHLGAKSRDEIFEAVEDFRGSVSFMKGLLVGNRLELTDERVRAIEDLSPAEFGDFVSELFDAGSVKRQPEAEGAPAAPLAPQTSGTLG